MIEAYDPLLHGKKLKSWLWKRSITLPDERLLSNLGFVANGLAVGFLFCTQAGQVYIDHVAADPEAPPDKRDEALDELIGALEAKAKELGFVMVMVLAALPVMKKRFLKCGYAPHGDYTLFYKVIHGGS